MRPKTCDAARNKWRGVLLQLEIDKRHLTGKHVACPICGGRDRFRFDNKGGNGTWICNQCGAGTGMDLLMQVKGWDFRIAASEVDKVLGNVNTDPPGKPPLSDENQRRLKNALWKASFPIGEVDPAGWYLAARVGFVPACPDLRFVEAAPVPGGGTSPAMIALVRDAVTGEPATIHRTFLTQSGEKADMDNPRAMMPGELPDSITVRLSGPAEVMGVAEGIETALAAHAKFDVPCHAALNATMLAKWQPPEGVRKVIVFGDCDDKFGGQAAAYTLAHRLSRKLQVEVRIPKQYGTDWADGIAA